ncbi:hypothetical protein [Phytohabitans aurantiacus]|uniref:Membrane transport protein MMPL domain-containing protein n=1 Tax=Phytohabitans aurantiacus TaxID=3016789 RepID=A0ABQ5QUE3_9ACTN|nr:hypothetical protein [Phytohabitans aurantiacus]GLH97334.1 hypothetical protein Pa4123_26090 [Phytohabitans aurantiacus]
MHQSSSSPATSTQSRHPWRATVRTIFAATVGGISLVPTIAATAGIDTVPAIGQVVIVSAAVTRVLALPGVDAWLRTYLPWLASAPQPPQLIR